MPSSRAKLALLIALLALLVGAAWWLSGVNESVIVELPSLEGNANDAPRHQQAAALHIPDAQVEDAPPSADSITVVADTNEIERKVKSDADSTDSDAESSKRIAGRVLTYQGEGLANVELKFFTKPLFESRSSKPVRDLKKAIKRTKMMIKHTRLAVISAEDGSFEYTHQGGELGSVHASLPLYRFVRVDDGADPEACLFVALRVKTLGMRFITSGVEPQRVDSTYSMQCSIIDEMYSGFTTAQAGRLRKALQNDLLCRESDQAEFEVMVPDYAIELRGWMMRDGLRYDAASSLRRSAFDLQTPAHFLIGNGVFVKGRARFPEGFEINRFGLSLNATIRKASAQSESDSSKHHVEANSKFSCGDGLLADRNDERDFVFTPLHAGTYIIDVWNLWHGGLLGSITVELRFGLNDVVVPVLQDPSDFLRVRASDYLGASFPDLVSVELQDSQAVDGRWSKLASIGQDADGVFWITGRDIAEVRSTERSEFTLEVSPVSNLSKRVALPPGFDGILRLDFPRTVDIAFEMKRDADLDTEFEFRVRVVSKDMQGLRYSEWDWLGRPDTKTLESFAFFESVPVGTVEVQISIANGFNEIDGAFSSQFFSVTREDQVITLQQPQVYSLSVNMGSLRRGHPQLRHRGSPHDVSPMRLDGMKPDEPVVSWPGVLAGDYVLAAKSDAGVLYMPIEINGSKTLEFQGHLANAIELTRSRDDTTENDALFAPGDIIIGSDGVRFASGDAAYSFYADRHDQALDVMIKRGGAIRIIRAAPAELFGSQTPYSWTFTWTR